jgi:hypothetical protein
MPSIFALAAPLALILPLLGQGSALVARSDAGEAASEGQPPLASAPDYEVPSEGPYSPARPVVSPLDAIHGGMVYRQVRIDQRVVIRISPQRPEGARNSLLAQLPPRGLTTRYEERGSERCVPVSRISGVQTGNGNRLLLFLSDQRILSLNLERACRARDFYSGFYVERSDDGQLCVDRDELQSRSGAKCEVETIRQLVAVRD